MAYDYKESQLRTWPTAAQAALWRSRALHEARRAAYWKHVAENAAAKEAGTNTPEPEPQSLPGKQTNHDN